MKRLQELELVLDDLRGSFRRAVELSRSYYMPPGWSIVHTRLDAWMQRFANKLRMRASELDEDDARGEKTARQYCSRGKGFCTVHQRDCSVHYHCHADGSCSCKPCFPPESNG